MIRIAVTPAALDAAIEAKCKGWAGRMAKKIEGLAKKRAPKFDNQWSKIKAVYRTLQHSKCAFCEKPLEGAIEQDVEHFRPKGAVAAWPVPAKLAATAAAAGFEIRQPAKRTKGYKYLAYHPLNYVTACKSCNSVRKKNYFPVAGEWRLGAKDPADRAAFDGERPYLIYPLADIDADPETLIAFNHDSPYPRKGLRGFNRLRALVTIELFWLDDLDERKELLKDRFRLLELVYYALRGRTTFRTKADRDEAARVVEGYKTGREPHTNCIKHFVKMYDDNPAKAIELYHDAVAYLKTVS